MTPKEKAQELIDLFKNWVECDNIREEPIYSFQKECALICVDEIILALPHGRQLVYYKEVKKEIELL